MMNNNDTDATVPALQNLRGALDDLMVRAENLDGVSSGTHHALQRADESLKSDHSVVQAVMAPHRTSTLREPFDARAGFLFDEEGAGDDDLETLSHDLDALAIQAGDLVGRGLLSSSTRALLEHAAHLLRNDLVAADSADSEIVQAREWDDAGEEESADLWPAAVRLATQRYGRSLASFKLQDPETARALLYEAEANRRKQAREW